jgi:hypothetical protein
MFQVENIWPAGASKKGGRRSSPELKPGVSAPRTIDELTPTIIQISGAWVKNAEYIAAIFAAIEARD